MGLLSLRPGSMLGRCGDWDGVFANAGALGSSVGMRWLICIFSDGALRFSMRDGLWYILTIIGTGNRGVLCCHVHINCWDSRD